MDNNINDPILFEVRSPESYKQFFDFQLFSLIHKRNLITILLLIIQIFIIISILCSLAGGNIKNAVIGIIYIVFCICFMLLTMHTAAKNHMKSPAASQNVNQYLFYQDYFVNNDITTQAVVRYDMLMCAYESKNYFYLFIENNRAYIIEKAHFIYNTPFEMRRLLQIKLGDRFMIK